MHLTTTQTLLSRAPPFHNTADIRMCTNASLLTPCGLSARVVVSGGGGGGYVGGWGCGGGTGGGQQGETENRYLSIYVYICEFQQLFSIGLLSAICDSIYIC